MFELLEKDQHEVECHIDDHGDSYARDTKVEELRLVMITVQCIQSDVLIITTRF